MTLCLMFDYFSDGVLGIDSVVSQSASTFTANGHPPPSLFGRIIVYRGADRGMSNTKITDYTLI